MVELFFFLFYSEDRIQRCHDTICFLKCVSYTTTNTFKINFICGVIKFKLAEVKENLYCANMMLVLETSSLVVLEPFTVGWHLS